jgi:hypothetical protein
MAKNSSNTPKNSVMSFFGPLFALSSINTNIYMKLKDFLYTGKSFGFLFVLLTVAKYEQALCQFCVFSTSPGTVQHRHDYYGSSHGLCMGVTL